MLRVASFNVNGIRASVRRGFADWLQLRQPDIVGAQELRCPPDDLPSEAWPGYHLSYHAGDRAGRNGVGLFTRTPPSAIRTGFGSRAFDGEGRYLEVDLEPRPGRLLRVASVYVPKGGRLHQDEEAARVRKERFLRSFGGYLTAARRGARRAGREFLVMGDFNIAHGPNDLANPAGNTRNPGYLPTERAWFEARLSTRTLVDVVRRQHGDRKGPYSWWTWRGQGWNNDSGWRIDYQLASPGLAATVVAADTDREADYDLRMSDHSPVVVDYDW